MEASAAPERSVSKSEFAALIGVSAGRISQYIAEKKLTGDALDGEGRAAKIRPSVAAEQLKRKLDIGQRLANGLDTKLNLQPPAQASAAADAGGGPGQPPAHTQATGTGAPPASPPASLMSTSNDLDEQIKRERLDQVRRQNRKAAEEEAIRAGLLTDAEAAGKAMGKIAASLVTLFEGALPDFAAAMASRFGVQQRDALHELRLQMRKVRARAAAIVKQKSERLPETVGLDIVVQGDDGEEAPAED